MRLPVDQAEIYSNTNHPLVSFKVRYGSQLLLSYFHHFSCHCQLRGKVENDTRIIALRHFYIFVAIFARLLLLYVFPCFITEL